MRRKKVKKVKKESLNIFIGPVVLLACLLMVIAWQVSIHGTNILGVSDATLQQTTTEPTRTNLPTPTTSAIIAPTAIPTPTPATALPVATPTTQPANILPTATPYVAPTSAFVPIPTPTPIAVITPLPTGAVIYSEIKTVPIYAYKEEIVFDPIIAPPPKINIDPSRPSANIDGNTTTTITPVPIVPNTTGRSLISEPLIVTTINKTTGVVENVSLSSNLSKITFENTNEEFTMNLTDVTGAQRPVAINAFETIAARLREHDMGLFVVGENEMLIQDGAVGAVTRFPVSITPQNDIFVNNKKLDLALSKAIEHLEDLNLITTVKTKDTSIDRIKQLTKIVDFKNTIALEVDGCKPELLLAAFPIPGGVCMTATISLEDKDYYNKVLYIYQSPIYQLLDILSI